MLKNQTLINTSPVQYDSFMFVDSLTNRSIAVKEINSHPRQLIKNHSKQKQVRSSQQLQMKQLDECLAFLKSTMAFRMKVLRHKLYKDVKKQDMVQKQLVENMTKKRLIRKLIQQEIEDQSRKQLTAYLNSPDKHPNQNLLNVVNHNSLAISKRNISNIVNSLQGKGSVTHGHQKLKTLQISDDAQMLRIDNLQKQIQGEIRQKLRKTGQFLVQPQPHIGPTNTSRFKVLRERLEQPHTNQDITDLKWIPTTFSSQMLQNSNAGLKKQKKEMNKEESPIFALVATADVEDVEVYASKCKTEVLKARDSAGNNLMHIAALYNKSAIFQWLLSVLGIQGLLQKNDAGESPIDVSVRLQHRQIINLIPRSLI